jgi:signal peptidase II
MDDTSTGTEPALAAAANPSPPPPDADAGRLKASFLLVALAVLVLDQWSKWLIEMHLPHLTSVTVIPGLLNFTHVRNTGVAFGLFASAGGTVHALMLALVGSIALLVVVVYFWRTPASDHLLLVALSMVLGGAIGNLMDRVAGGAVTDFIDFYFGTYHWHTFNVADSAITIGLLLMALDALRPRPARRDAAQREQPLAA